MYYPHHQNLGYHTQRQTLRPQLHQAVHISNKTLPTLTIPQKKSSAYPMTPSSGRDIDDELRRVYPQYQSSSHRFREKGFSSCIVKGLSMTTQPQNIEDQKLPASSQTSRQHCMFYKEDSRLGAPKSTFQLSSIDYLKPSLKNPSARQVINSQSLTTGGQVYRSQPYYSEIMPNVRVCQYEDQYKPEYNAYFTANHQESKRADITLQEIQHSLSFKQFKPPGLDSFLFEEKTSTVQSPSEGSPNQQKNEGVKITTSTSEFIKITESSPRVPITSDTQAQLERQNNHQRQTFRYHRQLSLPRITDTSKLSTSVDGGGSVREYIQTINQKNRAIVQLQQSIVRLETKLQEKDGMLQKYKIEIQNLKEGHKAAIEASNKLIGKLKKEIELTDVKRHSSNMDLESKFHKINMENQQISASNNILQRQISTLRKELTKRKQTEDNQEDMYTKLKSIIVEKTARVTGLEKSLDRVTEENNSLRRRVAELAQKSQPGRQIVVPEDNNEAFNSIVKMNEEENMKYKNNLAVKDEEIHRLQDLNRELRAANDTLRNQIEIERLKRMTDLKNLETTYQIEQQVKGNEIHSLNRSLHSLQEKLKFVIQEDRRKDEFMVQYLKSRADLPEDKLRLQDFFRKFELLSVNTNIVECLKRQQMEIQSLKAEVRRLILNR